MIKQAASLINSTRGQIMKSLLPFPLLWGIVLTFKAINRTVKGWGEDVQRDGHVVLRVRLLIQRFVEEGSLRAAWLIFRKTRNTLTYRCLMQSSSEDMLTEMSSFTTWYGLKRVSRAKAAGFTKRTDSIIQIASGTCHQSINVLHQFPGGNLSLLTAVQQLDQMGQPFRHLEEQRISCWRMLLTHVLSQWC